MPSRTDRPGPASRVDPVELGVFAHLFASAAEEVGTVLCRSAASPNIKERRDFSAAIFDARGRLVAQAAHIPVHLGSAAISVRAAIRARRFGPGDAVVLNDPYEGGTHLPDITLVTPVFLDEASPPAYYVATRAHHADVGGQAPGSMVSVAEIYQEGLRIPPGLSAARRAVEPRRAGSAAAQRAHARGATGRPGSADRGQPPRRGTGPGTGGTLRSRSHRPGCGPRCSTIPRV